VTNLYYRAASRQISPKALVKARAQRLNARSSGRNAIETAGRAGRNLADVEWNNERANFPESPARIFDSSRQRGSSSRLGERKHREGDISAINRGSRSCRLLLISPCFPISATIGGMPRRDYLRTRMRRRALAFSASPSTRLR